MKNTWIIIRNVSYLYDKLKKKVVLVGAILQTVVHAIHVSATF